MPTTTNFVIITPVRDEEEHIAGTIESVAMQTVPPAEWVIVNDGSTDKTGEILDRHASRLPWLRVVHRANRGYRKSGGGVIEAFYEGYRTLRSADWEFVIKLDGDLTFAADYFERCFEHFRSEARLGVGGGGIWHQFPDGLKYEANPQFHVRGATKIYRRQCWQDIKGLWPAPGWDTIDEVKANMFGWKTKTFEELRLIHHRLTGAADGSIRDRVKNGVANYISGYHPLFQAASCFYRLNRQPYVLGSLALLYGYLKAFFTRTPRVDDSTYINYIQSQQLRKLCGMETIWK